jgi:hypothetical protein
LLLGEFMPLVMLLILLSLLNKRPVQPPPNLKTPREGRELLLLLDANVADVEFTFTVPSVLVVSEVLVILMMFTSLILLECAVVAENIVEA